MDYGATWCGAGVSPQTGTFSELHQQYARNDHINDIYTVNQKNTPKCFLLYSLQNLTDCDRIWYVLSRVNLSVQTCKRFPPHLNTVSTLPCET